MFTAIGDAAIASSAICAVGARCAEPSLFFQNRYAEVKAGTVCDDDMDAALLTAVQLRE